MKLFIFILLHIIGLSCSSQQMINTSSRELVFRSVNVIPMDREQVIPDQVVVVQNGKIKDIGKTGRVKYSKDAVIINAKGKYLIPGLAEMHAHVPPVNDLEPMKEVLMLFALNGVTTIRGMLGHPRHLELRNKIQSGEITGPRFYTSGPSFNGNSVKTPAVADSMVRSQKAAGYDFLKLHPGLTRENFAAIEKAAKEVNIPFAGHVSFDVGIWRAINARYATIDHLDGFVEGMVPDISAMSEQETGLFALYISRKADTIQIPKLMKALKEHQVWVVPTQALAERWFDPGKDPDALKIVPEMKYMATTTVSNWVQTKKNMMSNPKFVAADVEHLIQLRRKLIFECNRSGVGLLLGSDAPQVFNVPGFSLHHELQYLVDAGLSSYEALKTGTVNVGVFYKRWDMGVIKKGALSDLVLLDGNPLLDISQTKRIAGVMLGKNWLSKEYIAAELKKLEKN